MEGINRCRFQVRANKGRANKPRAWIKSAVKVSDKRAFIIQAYAAMQLQAYFLDMDVYLWGVPEIA